MKNIADWVVQTTDYGMYTHKSTFWHIGQDDNILYIHDAGSNTCVAAYTNWLFIRKKEEAK